MQDKISTNDPVESTFFLANIIYFTYSPVKGTPVEKVVGTVVEIVGKLVPILVPKNSRHFQIYVYVCLYLYIYILAITHELIN